MKRILFSMMFLFVSTVLAEIKTNDYLPFEHYKNQFDQDMIVDNNIKMLIVTFSKAKGEVIKEFLEVNKGFLKTKNAHYLADVSSVPSFVMSMFMKPKFKSYDYEMGLIYDEEKALSIPKKDDDITVIYLENKKVQKIDFIQNLDLLK